MPRGKPLLLHALRAAMQILARNDDLAFLMGGDFCYWWSDEGLENDKVLNGYLSNKEWGQAMTYVTEKYTATEAAPSQGVMEPANTGEDVDELNEKLNMHDLSRAQVAWKQEYIGNSVDLLLRVLTQIENNFDQETDRLSYYAKTMALCQSSGAGKSKTLDELTTKVTGVVYTLRTGDQSGYPPGDEEITNMLCKGLELEGGRVYEHGLAIAFLGATIEMVMQAYSEFLERGATEEDRNRFPLVLHGQMAPKNIFPQGNPRESISSRISRTRSELRKERCRWVVKRTAEILKEFKQDDKWVDIFHPKDGTSPGYDRMHEHRLYQKLLLKPAQDAIKILPKRDDYEPILIIGLDEVALLTGTSQSTLFITALHRAVRGLRHLRLWVFLLSTKRPVKEIAPMISKDPSTRRRNKELAKAPPYYSFFLDLPMYRRMEDTDSAMKEIRKPLHMFSSLDHMAARGRALWSSFTHTDTQPLGPSDEIRGFVREKLLCSTMFDAKNSDHVFSILCSRVDLDPSLSGLESAALQEEAVNSRLRWVYDFDEKTGIFRSRTAPEPLVAEAATSVCVDRGTDRWKEMLQWFLETMCTGGMIEKGTLGELVARTIIIMARDAVFREDKPGEVLKASGTERRQHFQYSRPFLATAFIRKLVTDADSILGTPVRVKQKRVAASGATPMTLETLLQGAVMNFNTFIDTDVSLDPENVNELCHHLLCGQAALQCSHDQPIIDLLIPIYRARDGVESDFDPKQLAVLAVQVKNKINKTALDLTKPNQKDFYESHFVLDGVQMPVIAVTMDLSCPPLKDGKRVQIATSYNANVFGFHVNGYTHDTYHCVSDDMGGILTRILNSENDEETGQASCTQMNRLYDRHTWKTRYPTMNFKPSTVGPTAQLSIQTADWKRACESDTEEKDDTNATKRMKANSGDEDGHDDLYTEYG